MIGDIGADVEAARAAGARGILVPDAANAAGGGRRGARGRGDLAEAVELALRRARGRPHPLERLFMPAVRAAAPHPTALQCPQFGWTRPARVRATSSAEAAA